MPVVAVCGDGQGVSTGLPALREGGRDTQGARGEGSRSYLPRAVPLPTTAIPGADGWLLARDSPQDPLGGPWRAPCPGFSCLTTLATVSALMWLGPKGFLRGPNGQQGERAPLHLSGSPGGDTGCSHFLSHNSQVQGVEDPAPPSPGPPSSCLDYFPHQKLYSPVSFSKPGPWSVTVEGTGIKLHSFSRWHSCRVGCLTAPPVFFSSSQGLSRDKVQNCRRAEHRNS